MPFLSWRRTRMWWRTLSMKKRISFWKHSAEDVASWTERSRAWETVKPSLVRLCLLSGCTKRYLTSGTEVGLSWTGSWEIVEGVAGPSWSQKTIAQSWATPLSSALCSLARVSKLPRHNTVMWSLCCRRGAFLITESQNGRGWEGPLWVI